jgi:hypothetical protein
MSPNLMSVPEPRHRNQSHDHDRSQDRYPTLGIETGAFEFQLMVRHDTALHLKNMKRIVRGFCQRALFAKSRQMTDRAIVEFAH